MNNIEDFITDLVSIEHLSEFNAFGHYPFQLIAQNEKEGLVLEALALGGDVAKCYQRFANYIFKGYKKIYMSIDFPAGGDIINDFVCILSFENKKFEIIAIPYNNQTGEVFPRITKSTQLVKILKEFKLLNNLINI